MAEEKLIRIEIGAREAVTRHSRQRGECAGKDAHDDWDGKDTSSYAVPVVSLTSSKYEDSLLLVNFLGTWKVGAVGPQSAGSAFVELERVGLLGSSKSWRKNASSRHRRTLT